MTIQYVHKAVFKMLVKEGFARFESKDFGYVKQIDGSETPVMII